jgi:hypothetical protein
MDALLTEQMERLDEEDDEEHSPVLLFTPEGVNKVPFSSTELNLLDSSKLSSTFHGRTLHNLRTKDFAKKLYDMSRNPQDLASTPQSSPRLK